MRQLILYTSKPDSCTDLERCKTVMAAVVRQHKDTPCLLHLKK